MNLKFASFADNIGLFVCTMLTIVSVIFATVAYRSWNANAKIIQNGQSTEGVVVELLQKKSKKKNVTKAPVVMYQTPTGASFKYYSTLYTYPSSYTVGQKVTIWYLPDNPQEATLDGADAYLMPLIFGGFGFLALVFGLPTVVKFLIQRLFRPQT